MKAFCTLTALVAAVAASGHSHIKANRADVAVQQPSTAPMPNKATVQGCFKSAGDLVFDKSDITFMTISKCGHDMCGAQGKKVGATTQGTKCYCGDKYPPKSTLADPKMCNVTCTGYGEACGGLGYFTVYNTGVELVDVDYSDEDTVSSSSSSAASKPTAATTTSATETMVVTESSTPAPDSGESDKPKTNTAGIAAGVVVGVVVVGAGVGAFFFFMRRRRNREIEEEHRRNAAVNAFMGKPPGSSGGWSGSDSRMEPVMAQRRMSSGSIADNEDYSRRILRVTNA